MRRNINLITALLGLASVGSGASTNILSSPKFTGKSRQRTISKYGGYVRQIQYPEHYTASQRGFTPAGSAKLHFQNSNLINTTDSYQSGRPYINCLKAIKAGKINLVTNH